MLKMEWWHIVVGCLLMLLTGTLVFMWFDTTPPYVFDPEESVIIPEKAERGWQVRVDWKIVKINRFCGGINVRTLFDARTKARLAIYDPVAVAAPYELDNNDHLVRTFLLPSNIPPGKVGYRAHQFYSCNWLQKFWPFEVVTPDLFFEIVEGPDAGR